MMTSKSDKKWLIKSENKILGPYSFEQIEDLLLKKQISLIDEVRDTSTRWLYLRENIELKKTIDAVRIKLDAKSESTKAIHTNISQIGTQTAGENMQATQTSTDQYTDVSLNVQEASIVSETASEVITRAHGSFDQVERNKSGKVKSYAFQNDYKTQERTALFSKKFLFGILFASVFSGLVIFSYFVYNKHNQQQLEQESIAQIKKYKLLGLDQKAVESFSALSSQLQKKYLIDVIELFPLLESAGLVQIKDIDTVERAMDLQLEDKVNLLLARFWFYMQTQNLDLAQNQIVKAKTLQPSNSLVIENEAILNLKTGKYRKAIDAFSKLYSKEQLGRYVVGALQGLSGLSQAERAKANPEIEKLVDRHVATKYDFKKELLLAQMAFAKLDDNNILFKLSWKQFLNTPVQLQAQFKKPMLLAPFSYLWKDLDPYKVIVRQGLSQVEDIQFQVHDYLESAQLSAAVDFVEKNLNAITDTQTKAQVNLLIDYSLGKRHEIISLDKADLLDKKSELNHLILALNKIEIQVEPSIENDIEFFKTNNIKFYDQWVRLSLLMKKKTVPDIKLFLKNNFLAESDFILVHEARGLVE